MNAKNLLTDNSTIMGSKDNTVHTTFLYNEIITDHFNAEHVLPSINFNSLPLVSKNVGLSAL